MTNTIAEIKNPVLSINGLSVAYDGNYAVKDVSVDIKKNAVTAIMGPSGCGKSTLLRALNRIHELYENISTEGKVLLNGENIYEKHFSCIYTRTKKLFFIADILCDFRSLFIRCGKYV